MSSEPNYSFVSRAPYEPVVEGWSRTVPMFGAVVDDFDRQRRAEKEIAEMQDWFLSDVDDGSAQRARAAFGDNMMVKGNSQDNMTIAGGALASKLGIFHNPELYWTSRNLEVPQVQESHELLAYMARDFDQRAHEAHAAAKARRDAVANAEAARLQNMLDFVGGREIEEGSEAVSLADAGHLLGMDISASEAQEIRDVMVMIRQFNANTAKDSTSRSVVGMEWFRDAIMSAVTNEDGSLHPQKWQLFQACMQAFASELQVSEETGNDEYGFGHRASSSILKILTDLASFTEQSFEANAAMNAEKYLLIAEAAKGKSKAERAMIAATMGLPVPTDKMIAEARETLRHHEHLMKKEPSRRKVAGFMRQMSNTSERIGDEVAWYRQAYLKVGEATPATAALVISPYLGGAAMFLAQNEEALNQNYYAGMNPQEARLRAFQTAGISTVVEMLPGSALGGMPAYKAFRLLRGNKVTAPLAVAASKVSARGTGTALAVEIGTGFVDESFIEPTAQAVLNVVTDYAFVAADMTDSPVRSWGESFKELREIWNFENPSTLASIAFISAAVGGVQIPGLRLASKEAHDYLRSISHNEGVWQAMGLSDKNVRKVVASANPLEAGRVLLAEEVARDREGVKARMRANGARLQEEGFTLRLTGQTDEASAEMNMMLAESYRELVQDGVMPQVERLADRDGQAMYRITERSLNGEEVVEQMELPAKEADDYLQLRMMSADARRAKRDQQTVYEEISEHVDQIAGTALAQRAEQEGATEGLHMEDMNKLGGGIGKKVQQEGALSFQGMKLAVKRLGEHWQRVVDVFKERAYLAGRKPEGTGTRGFRWGWHDVPVNREGRTVFGSIIMYAQGNIRPQELMEESVETRTDMWLQDKAQQMMGKEEGLTREEADKRALEELGNTVRQARAVLMEIEPGLQISEVPDNPSYMQVVEAMSDIGRARLLHSSVLPAWMSEVQDMVSGALHEAAEGIRIAKAAQKAAKNGVPAYKALEDIFASFDLPLGRVFSTARVDASVIETVRLARARMRGDAVAPTAAEVQDRQQEEVAEEEALEAAELPGDEPPAGKAGDKSPDDETAAILPAMPDSKAPASMQGVFVHDACVYNAAGGFYMGCVPVKNLRDSKDVQQVKAGAKGKHGVVNPITGDYQQATEAIYVWRRKDGTLEVISGRHKYALALETGTETAVCYVFNEDAEHDAKWARLLDFENNMRGDQADELTAAIYTRETGYDDATLRRKGLMRNKSKSKRGILIGREARQELWDRFANGAVSAMDAEIICTMTQGIRDKGRVDEIQRRCCMLLEQGKSWEYISAMVQLMANKESVFMKQGLLDLGADFEADMERAASYVEKCVQKLTEAIGIIKGGRRLSGAKKQLAESLGQFTTSSEASEALLNDLVDMRERFRNIGAYPDLVASASMWDGQTELDPIAMARSYAHSELEQAAAEQNMTREEWEEEQAAKEARRAAAEGTGTLGFSMIDFTKSLPRMIAPNGQPSKLTPAQWDVAHKEEFKAWFGDWHKVALFWNALNWSFDSEPVVSITGQEFQKDNDDITAKVPEYWNASYGGVANNPIIGKVKLDKRSVKASMHHGLGSVKAAAFAVVHDVIEKGRIANFETTWKGRGYDSYVIFAPVEIGDQTYICEAIVLKSENRTGFYLHEVQMKERLVSAFKTGVNTGTLTASLPKILREIYSRVNTESAKIAGKVDANGEPLAQYVDSYMKLNNISGSIVDMTKIARMALRRREDDLEAQELIERWDKQLAMLETASAGDDDGSARYAVLLALLESTRQVLPPQHAKLGRLHMLMKWAAVYGHMVSTGQVPRNGVLKGAIFEKFAAAMQQRLEGGRLKGLSEEDARAVLRELGEQRLEDALLKVARACRERLDEFVKFRARERIDLLAKRAWPKKESGKKSPRGKMEADFYRAMNTMLAWLNATPNEVAQRVSELRTSIAELEASGWDGKEGSNAELESLRNELRIVQLYGDWKGMSAVQAVRVADDFAEFVATARHTWDEQVELERRRIAWQRMQMTFTKEYNANSRKAEKEGKDKKRRSLKAAAANLMSYAQLMLSLRPVLGNALAREKVQQIADAETAMLNARNERDNAFARCVQEATGLRTQTEQVAWLNDFAKVEEETGIFLREQKRHALEMTQEEALRWIEMPREEREAARRAQQDEVARTKLAPANPVPTEAQIDALERELEAMHERWQRQDARMQAALEKKLNGRELSAEEKEKRLAAAERRMQRRSGFKVRTTAITHGKRIQLKASRDAVANAVLTLEQKDYHHLIEHEGLIPRDKDGNEIDRAADPHTPLDVEQTLKPLYDFIGEQGRAFVYGLRRYVGENGKQMQAVYEARQGVPLAMKADYWRGNFDISTVNPKDTLTENNGGAMGGGGYGFLIDRVHHYSRLNWANTATMVFGVTVSTQNCYTYMSGICHEWRMLLADRDFASKFRTELGEEWFGALRDWVNTLEKAAVADSASLLALGVKTRQFTRALAFVHLAGNIKVYMKQVSGILHGLMGGEVPRGVIEGSPGAQEMAWQKIGFAEYAAAMARTLRGKSKVSMKELSESKWFAARRTAEAHRVAARMGLEEGRKQHVYADAATDILMEGIEFADRGSNLLGMQALADAVYRNLESINRKQSLGLTEEQIKQEALASVGRALAVAAAPKSAASKSLAGARGNIWTNILFQFRSETVNKLGLLVARWTSGEAGVAVRDYFMFGALNAAVLAGIAWLYSDDDDKKRRKKEEAWKPYARFGLDMALGDLAAMPALGDIINAAKAAATEDFHRSQGILERFFNPMEVWRISKRLYTGKKGRKRMDWDDYMVEVNKLLRWAGLLSPFGKQGATWGELLLSAAAAGNALRSAAETGSAVVDKVAGK